MYAFNVAFELNLMRTKLMGLYGSIDTKNNGFGGSMAYAGRQAISQHFGQGSYESQHSQSERWEQFVQYAKENEINDTRKIDQVIVEAYGKEMIKNGLAVTTAQNHISAINVVMNQLREGGWVKVSQSKVVGEKSNIRKDAPKSLDQQKYAHVHYRSQHIPHNR